MLGHLILSYLNLDSSLWTLKMKVPLSIGMQKSRIKDEVLA